MWRVLCLAALLAACLGAQNPYNIGGCSSSQRMCRSVKKCVSLMRVCDGNNDCGDNSDEYDCPGFTCPPGRFKCERGPCIPARWRCDDYEDCRDGSDEAGCPPSSAGQQQQQTQQSAEDDDQFFMMQQQIL